MFIQQPVGDRRSALKARHRQAIIDAAISLMERTGGIDFTVTDLADAADVSRRTVFNHFDTVDDIVVAACREVLLVITAPIESAPPADRSMFDEVADALRRPDLVDAMVRMGRMLGSDTLDAPSPRQAMLFLRVLSDVGSRVSAALRRRYPEVDVLAVDLLVSSLMSGAITVHEHWVAATGWSADEASRSVWTELIERLIAITASGHAATREIADRRRRQKPTKDIHG